MEHPWPGNVRELRNLMERLAYLSSGERIEAEDLAFILSPRGQTPLVADMNQSLADATGRFQAEYIRRQVEQSGGNMSLAAARLGPAPLESLPQDAAVGDGYAFLGIQLTPPATTCSIREWTTPIPEPSLSWRTASERKRTAEPT